MPRIMYHLQVIWACMSKEIKSALTERTTTIMGVFLPANFLILMSLFAVSGGLAPTAVVMKDKGPYARQFYDAMTHAHSFRLQTANAQLASSPHGCWACWSSRWVRPWTGRGPQASTGRRAS